VIVRCIALIQRAQRLISSAPRKARSFVHESVPSRRSASPSGCGGQAIEEVMAGVDIRTVQELMGHKSITMTMRYAHLSPQHRIAALEKLCESTATTTATKPKSTQKPVAVNAN